MVKQKKSNSSSFLQNDVKKRLKDFMKAAHINQQELAISAEISKQAVTGYMGDSLPTAPILTAWSIELDLNINWLLLGEGPMFRREIGGADQHETRKLKDELTDVLRENRDLNNENKMLRAQLASGQHDAFPARPASAHTGRSVARSGQPDND
ncbi:MAG: helix-turn-helix domain containing protein [Desulfobulbaceae bacterium]|jgi:transcriptional regulator with XRE-family HTH domain|nr:helix-turn-helix domain containing protein [Desulfobulbaceae bacterium]